MKILFSTSENSLRSGAFHSTALLAAELGNLGVECLVLLPRKGDGQLLLDELGVRHRQVRSVNWVRPLGPASATEQAKWLAKKTYNRVISLPRIRRVYEEERPDIVHICSTWGYNGAEAAKSLGIPYVWHARENIEKGQGLTFCDRDYALGLMGGSSCVIAVSNRIRADYAALLPQTRVVRIYNGIDPSRYFAGPRQVLGGEVAKVCVVGGVVEGKGQDVLVDALGLLAHRMDPLPFEVTLVGGMPDSAKGFVARLRSKIAEQRLADVVTLAGSMSDPERVMKGCDISVTCSRYEAFGRVTVEAMMAGCLAIGSNSGGTPEVIQDDKTGWLFEPGSPEDLARVLEHAVTQRAESRAIAAAGQQDAMECFTARRNAEDVLGVYEDVLANRLGGGTR